jgi:hypothetical protein
MTGPHPDEDEQHLVIHLDASTQEHAWQVEHSEVEPPSRRSRLLQRYRYGLAAVVALVLLTGMAYAIGAATYDPPSRLPSLVFTEQPLFGTNQAVASELDLIREAFSEPGALELQPAGPVFELALPRTVADRLFGERDEVARVFVASSPAGEFRFLTLSEGSTARIFAVEAPPGLSSSQQPAGIFLALDPADPALAPLVQALDAVLPSLDGLAVKEVSSDVYYVFGPFEGAEVENLRSRVAGNVVLAHLAGRLEVEGSDVSLAAPVVLVLPGPSRGAINALYHPPRHLIMEPLWGESSTASLAHELVHAYLDTVAEEREQLLTAAADYLEGAHPVLHGQVVGDLYERLGREGRAEETLAFLAGAVAAGQTRTVSTQRLLESPGNLMISEAVLYADLRLLVQAGLLPACMLPRPEAHGDLTHAYYENVESACSQ